MTSQSLLKILTGAGLGSRRKMAQAIKQERVSVNGQIITDFRYQVNPETDRVFLDGKPLELEPKQIVTLMLHKPKGIICTLSDERGRRTVTDILPEKYRSLRLYPVGRLDKDSTGLLLLTNDGELAYKLTHPKFEHEKEYLVHIEGRLRPEEKRQLEQGLELEDGITHPAKVREVKSSPPFNYSLTIHEGRKRQVRRMFAHLGHRVLALKRIRLGNLTLGNLPEGKTRELSAREMRALLQ
ncbi:MAG TPA: rRNA pseudouridine synthase [Dehalococcoidia bacterium]|jgi:23S rRNA pseudouridine2605 synthase|nr:rRNA pseudouridine synthase [Dehalococcoidia bacterium]